jgi:predicted MFS family arabinose efflux permease
VTDAATDTGHASPVGRVAPRVELAGVLTAAGVSILGSRVSALAIPWLVLVTSGSPVRMGLVAAAELVPYVLATALGGPIIDRLGTRRTAVVADLASAAAMGCVVAFHDLGVAALLVMVAIAGGLRGFGDNAKRVHVLPAATRAGVPVVRVTAIYDGLNRLSLMISAAVAGLLIAWVGPATTILVNVGAFIVAGALVAAVASTTPAGSRAPREPYLRAMRVAITHLRGDRLTAGLVAMLFVINVFNQAGSVVFTPLWADEVFGSPVAFGAVLAAIGLGLVLGNVVFTVLATRLPRYATFTVGFLIGGAPRFLVLGFSDDLATVLTVSFLAGCALASVNPIIGVVLFERTPVALQARVFGLATAVAYAGLPVGGLLGGWAVAAVGLRPALIATGVLYLAVALLPVVRHRSWRQLDRAAAPEETPS